MKIAKKRIVDALNDRGEHFRASWVDRELPEHVDTTQHAGLLVTLHLDEAHLAGGPPS